MTHIVFLRCKMLFTHAAAFDKTTFGAMYLLITHPRSLSIPGKRLSETEIVIERNAADGLEQGYRGRQSSCCVLVLLGKQKYDITGAADGLDGGLLRGTPLMLTLVLSSQKVQYKDSGRLSRGFKGHSL